MTKIQTKDLFNQIQLYGILKLNREQLWDKAIEMGFKWNILEGVWVKNE